MVGAHHQQGLFRHLRLAAQAGHSRQLHRQRLQTPEAAGGLSKPSMCCCARAMASASGAGIARRTVFKFCIQNLARAGPVSQLLSYLILTPMPETTSQTASAAAARR